MMSAESLVLFFSSNLILSGKKNWLYNTSLFPYWILWNVICEICKMRYVFHLICRLVTARANFIPKSEELDVKAHIYMRNFCPQVELMLRLYCLARILFPAVVSVTEEEIHGLPILVNAGFSIYIIDC